jgi:hypothetical protein
VWFVPSGIKNRSRSEFIGCNSEIISVQDAIEVTLEDLDLCWGDNIQVDIKEIGWQTGFVRLRKGT